MSVEGSWEGVCAHVGRVGGPGTCVERVTTGNVNAFLLPARLPSFLYSLFFSVFIFSTFRPRLTPKKGSEEKKLNETMKTVLKF